VCFFNRKKQNKNKKHVLFLRVRCCQCGRVAQPGSRQIVTNFGYYGIYTHLDFCKSDHCFKYYTEFIEDVTSLLPRIPEVFRAPLSSSFHSISYEESFIAIASTEVATAALAAVSPITAATGAIFAAAEITESMAAVSSSVVATASEIGVKVAADAMEMSEASRSCDESGSSSSSSSGVTCGKQDTVSELSNILKNANFTSE